MIGLHKRRVIFGGTITAGVILSLAGAAFACATFRGDITGTGNGSGNVSTTVTGNPSAGQFQWCEDPPVFSGTSDATREAFWGTKVAASGPSLTVTVAPADTCLQDMTVDSNFLPTATYKVGISEGYWDETAEGFATGDEDNCQTLETSSGPGYGTIIDTTYSVTNGSGSETFSGTGLDSNLRDAVGGAGGWNTVCVYLPEGQTVDPFYFGSANALNFRSL